MAQLPQWSIALPTSVRLQRPLHKTCILRIAKPKKTCITVKRYVNDVLIRKIWHDKLGASKNITERLTFIDRAQKSK